MERVATRRDYSFIRYESKRELDRFAVVRRERWAIVIILEDTLKKWTKSRIKQSVEILQRNTEYQEALDELGETKDSLYNAFYRAGMGPPTEYLADSQEDILRRREMTRSDKIRTIVVFNDIHIPFHHEAACRNVIKFCRDHQPDNIVINGDLMDCWAVSDFPKQKGGPDLQTEIDLTVEFLDAVRSACPAAEIDWTEGNHEYRLKRFVKTHHSLYGLRAFTIEALTYLEDFKINYHPYKLPLTFGKQGTFNELCIVHGHRVSKHSAYSGKAHMIDEGYPNVIIGHTHRMGSYYHTGHYGRRRSIENGGLFDKGQLDYVVNPNWQNGFCVVSMLEDEESFIQIEPIEMQDDGSFIWKGMLYRS